MSEVEQRYTQTEREALAVVWACEHFHIYLSGAPFTVITDHQPLLGIWKKPHPSLRIARWGLRLQPYRLSMKYSPGKDNPADYMSRHPSALSKPTSREERIAEEYVNFVVKHAVPPAVTLEQVRVETAKDATLQAVMSLVRSQWQGCEAFKNVEGIHYEALLCFRAVQEELVVTPDDSTILRGRRLVIPTSLQRAVLELSHEGHQGITKTKANLRSKVWFPNIDTAAETMVRSCVPCQANISRLTHTPLQMSSLPSGPWQKLSVDFCGPIPSGEYLFVIIDEFSRFPVVHTIRNVSADTVIPCMAETFGLFGYPKSVKSDNGPPFQSAAWRRFLDESGVNHRRITPLWPQANAQAESFNKPMMKAVRAAVVQGRDWKQCLTEFLRMYRTTPHSTTQFTPYRLLFERDPRTKLPQIDANVKHKDDDVIRERDGEKKQAMKEYADSRRHAKSSDVEAGDVVLVKQGRANKLSTPFNPEPLIVSDRKGDMVTATRSDGSSITRNVAMYRDLPDPPLESMTSSDSAVPPAYPDDELTHSGERVGQREAHTPEERPKRARRKPQRLIEEV